VIKVDRTTVTAPASLARRATSGAHVGLTEEEAIVVEYAAYLAAVPRPKTFGFAFKAYKNDDVKAALADLFHGKCAYCEQRYAGTQPMDVEHWRPKGGVEEVDALGAKVLAEGYPWLAARWTNLLPSCIDCNRPRIQRDVVTGESVTLGKANQFPVTGARMPPPAPGDLTPQVEDSALIIDPTIDDPTEHLSFRDDGAVLGRTDKGEQSIRVYALNRAELAFERLGLAKLIEQRLTTIEALAAVIADQALTTDLQRDLQDLVSHEIDALMELADPGRPFSAMARQLIEENSPLQISPHPAAVPWSTDVAAMLQRFTDHAPGAQHLRVASQLAGLGFAPHLAASAAPYVRWVAQGTERSVALYQNSAGLTSESARQRDEASRLPGAQLTGDRVRFGYASATLDQVLAAATGLRDWADRP